MNLSYSKVMVNTIHLELTCGLINIQTDLKKILIATNVILQKHTTGMYVSPNVERRWNIYSSAILATSVSVSYFQKANTSTLFCKLLIPCSAQPLIPFKIPTHMYKYKFILEFQYSQHS